MKILSVFGTRPEAIKMAPLVSSLSRQEEFETLCAVTAQHREMLDQVLEVFNLSPDYDLNIMTENQSLHQITGECLRGLKKIYEKEKPHLVLVQGDTSTTLAAALAAYYLKIPAAHVEAGLRSGDPFNPFPEENNRRMTDILSDFHFAPTRLNRENLLRENIKEDKIFVSGNTVIDALLETSRKAAEPGSNELKKIAPSRRVVLVTAHRRENWGQPLENICRAVKELSEKFKDFLFIYPLHMNPVVKNTAESILGVRKNVLLLKPLSYPDMVWLLKRSYLCLSDSGGLQEEAPALGKPVLVLREVTERPEGVGAGTVKVVGSETENIITAAGELLTDEGMYEKFSKAVNPYGDGHACERITEYLKYRFGFIKREPSQWKM